MDNETLSHTTWSCKYHIVFAPKYRRQIIYGRLKEEVGKILLFAPTISMWEHVDPFTGGPVEVGKKVNKRPL